MTLKKLRESKKLSQEQLAIMAGLSVRTIQRIEYGHKASLETLKALASVLEVELSLLEQEIDVIDKAKEDVGQDRPRAVTHAVIAIYGATFMTVIFAIAGRWMGELSGGAFFGYVLLQAIFCILPYKINNGSNAARYVFLVMIISSWILVIGYPEMITSQFDWIAGWASTPFEAYAVYCLLRKESNRWFSPRFAASSVSA